MKNIIVIRTLEKITPSRKEIEIVERKGLGHPDTICDHAAESVSVALCKYYLEEYGSIMHHNVDKALLVGGQAQPAFMNGRLIEPIEIIIAGRAVMEKINGKLSIEELASLAIRDYVRDHFRFLNPERDVHVTTRIGAGSEDLIDLFRRFGKGELPLANDTSYGVGFYPFDELENAVYKTERFLNGEDVKSSYGFIGEDIKIMGIRTDESIYLTIAIAFVGSQVSDLEDYVEKKQLVKKLIKDQEWIRDNYMIDINTADSYESGSIYLTVTGTSAEQGDDGEVGRGNRANGLITPSRAMTLEAVAGKNPISHVGKLYNLFAIDLSRELVQRSYAEEAIVNIVSQIGKPITEPQILDIKLRNQTVKSDIVRDLSMHMLQELPGQWKKVIRGEYEIA